MEVIFLKNFSKPPKESNPAMSIKEYATFFSTH